MKVKVDSEALSSLQPKAKPYKTAIGHGLYLLTMPNGSKRWRLKYYFEQRENTLSIGAFPAIGLVQAIKARDAARSTLKTGINPNAARKAERAERTQQRVRAKAFRLVMSLDNALTIETPRQILSLTREQIAAVRAFLLATPEGTSHAAD